MLSSPMYVCKSHGKNIQPLQEEKASAGTQETMIRPLNAFILWSFHQRRINSFNNLCNCEINKRLRDQWKLLEDNEKQPFIDEANRLEEQHKINYPDYPFTSLLWLNPPIMNPFLTSVAPHHMPFTFLPMSNAHEFRSNLPESSSNLLAARIPTHGMHSVRYPIIPKDANTRCAKSMASTSSAAHNTQTQKALPAEYKFATLKQKADRPELTPIDSVRSNANNPSFAHHGCPELQQNDQEYPLDLSIRNNQ